MEYTVLFISPQTLIMVAFNTVIMVDGPDAEMPIERRKVIQTVGGSVIPATVLAGCSTTSDNGNTQNTSEPQNNEGTTASGSQKQGGHLRIAVPGGYDTLNPIMHTAVSEYHVTEQVYSSLTQIQPDMSVEGDLATDWESNNDGETWIFDLHEDARWHNGNRVLAEDVKATFDAILSEEFASPARNEVGPIDSVDVVNDTTVQFNLSSSYGLLPKKMAKVRARIVPKRILDQGPDSDAFSNLATEPEGSGPFKLETFRTGDRVEFSAVDDWWKTDDEGNSLPYLDKQTHLVLPDSSAAINGMSNNNVDHYNRPTPAKWNRIENMSSVETNTMPGGTIFPVVVRVDKEPFDDNRVRQAMKYAVDKVEMLEVAANGLGTLGYHQPISPAYQYFDDELTHKFGKRAQPEKAKELLAEAGYPDGIDTGYDLYHSPEHLGPIGPTATLFQEYMSEIGIEFGLQSVPIARFFNINDELPLKVTYLNMRLSVDDMFNLAYTTDAPWNHSSYNWPENPDADFGQVLENGMRTTDTEEKAQYFAECQRIFQDKGAQIIPFYYNRIEAYKQYEQNFQMEPTANRLPLEQTWLTSDAPTKE